MSNLISSADFEFTDSRSFTKTDRNTGYILQKKDSFNFPINHLFFQFSFSAPQLSCLALTDQPLEEVSLHWLNTLKHFNKFLSSFYARANQIYILPQTSFTDWLTFYNSLLVETGTFPFENINFLFWWCHADSQFSSWIDKTTKTIHFHWVNRFVLK